MKCPDCRCDIPMPDLACDCPEPSCTDCHNRLGHPGSPCPECPNSRGLFVVGRRSDIYPVTAVCATCNGTGRLS